MTTRPRREPAFDLGNNIVLSRGGYDPEADNPHIVAVQVQVTIGVGRAFPVIVDQLGYISSHLDSIAATQLPEGNDQ
jgi:hypothetical protein